MSATRDEPGDRDERVRVIEFWRAVEVFSPQPLPRPDARFRVTDAGPGEPMPWEPGLAALRAAAAGEGVAARGVRRGVRAQPGPRHAHRPVRPGRRRRPARASRRPVRALRRHRRRRRRPGPRHRGALLVRLGRRPGPGRAAATFRWRDSARTPACSAATSAASPARTPRRQAPSSPRCPAPPGTTSRRQPARSRARRRDRRGPGAAPAARRGPAALRGRTRRPARRDRRRSGRAACGSGPTWWTPTGPDEQTAPSFLNSFYADDLARVAAAVADGDAGAGLTAYLTGSARIDAERRVDVRARPDTVWHGCLPARIPPGRWPADFDRSLALSQQFAVNEIMARLGTAPGLTRRQRPAWHRKDHAAAGPDRGDRRHPRRAPRRTGKPGRGVRPRSQGPLAVRVRAARGHAAAPGDHGPGDRSRVLEQRRRRERHRRDPRPRRHRRAVAGGRCPA